MKTRDPWRVLLPMGRPQTFRTEADAVAYAEANGGTVEEVGRAKREARAALDKVTAADDIPADVRAAVRLRSRGWCEVGLDGCGRVATGQHHRLKRRARVHTAENLLDICPNCHTASPAAIHRNVAWSIEVGLLLNSWELPPTEPWTRARLTE